jgi:hypothetical protein
MKRFSGLGELVAALPDLNGRVDISAKTRTQLAHGEPDALITAIYLVVDRESAPRMSWSPWYDTAVLAKVPWGTAPVVEVFEQWFKPGSAAEHLFDGSVEEPAFDMVWPSGTMLDRWAPAVLLAVWDCYANLAPERLNSATRIAIAACEERIGCPLPANLAAYHLTFGTTRTQEQILAVDPANGEAIVPLLEAYPGIPDIVEDPDLDAEAILAQVAQLVAFSAYLGNGNYWCFERGTGAVWYFDHDGGEPLTKMFDDVGDYFDALTVCAIGRIQEAEEPSKGLLVQHLGLNRVQTWLY